MKLGAKHKAGRRLTPGRLFSLTAVFLTVLFCAAGVRPPAVAQSEKDRGGVGAPNPPAKISGRIKTKAGRRKAGRATARKAPARVEIYRVRVTVIDGLNNPVDDARVRSTVGGEPKKVEGGWQFDIPAASKPLNGKVTFYATKENAFSRGQSELQLGDDPNPAITVKITRPTEGVMIRGIVTDESGRAIAGARVSILGYEAEAVVTRPDGGFVLPAHAADGQQVRLHVEAAKYKAVSQWHPAGEFSVEIRLVRE
jgi:hypothetical protein